jgi:major intrinsic protein
MRGGDDGGARGLLPGVRDPGLLLMESLEAGGASPSRIVGLSLPRRAVAEAIGTALLLAAVIGSGVSASRLSPNDVGLQLFENAMATGAALVAIILAFGPVSGACLNPVVAAVDAGPRTARRPRGVDLRGASSQAVWPVRSSRT